MWDGFSSAPSFEVAAGVVALMGVAVRRRRRVRGDVMIAAGVLPVVPWYRTYVFPIAAVTVVAAALVDAADGLPSASGARRNADDRMRTGLVAALAAVEPQRADVATHQR